MRHRFESFGGIIASDEPPFLAFVDRLLMRELGLGESPLWESADERIGLLSAPTEVHLATTSACAVRCDHCYMDAGEKAADEMDGAALRHALELLAAMGVFHVALGGGEALLRSDLFDAARYARELGLVPNLTISGGAMSRELARRMAVFGQVNVSVDGIGPYAGAFRAAALFERADAAISMLLDAGVPAGINCVLGRRNFDGLPGLFAYAKDKGCNEIELLRLKPAGRGAVAFLAQRTSYEQNVALTPLLAELSQRHGLRAKLDCSFVPMMCHHRPPLELLEATATYGCEAANVLVGVRSDGTVAACSFLPGAGFRVGELRERWRTDPGFAELRGWAERAPEPCRSCAYLGICKGGCHAVAAFVSGSIFDPDPDCPRVVEHRSGQAGEDAHAP
ncbi:MAG: radical SAM protein [Deltaproteobacteria bacterium]|nr:radical SAM protein [Deltaproteobacteria bacterium]